MKAKTVISLVFIILILIVHIQNTQVVTMHLFFWSFAMSQIVLMLILLAFGFASGFVVAKLTCRQKATGIPSHQL